MPSRLARPPLRCDLNVRIVWNCIVKSWVFVRKNPYLIRRLWIKLSVEISSSRTKSPRPISSWFIIVSNTQPPHTVTNNNNKKTGTFLFLHSVMYRGSPNTKRSNNNYFHVSSPHSDECLETYTQKKAFTGRFQTQQTKYTAVFDEIEKKGLWKATNRRPVRAEASSRLTYRHQSPGGVSAANVENVGFIFFQTDKLNVLKICKQIHNSGWISHSTRHVLKLPHLFWIWKMKMNKMAGFFRKRYIYVFDPTPIFCTCVWEFQECSTVADDFSGEAAKKGERWNRFQQPHFRSPAFYYDVYQLPKHFPIVKRRLANGWIKIVRRSRRMKNLKFHLHFYRKRKREGHMVILSSFYSIFLVIMPAWFPDSTSLSLETLKHLVIYLSFKPATIQSQWF